MTYFLNKSVFAQKATCTMIVGERPGRQLKGRETLLCWEGNRSADLMQEAIKGKTNILLTNVVNKQTMSNTRRVVNDYLLKQEIRRLKADIKAWKPYRIVFVGYFALRHGKEALRKSKHNARISFIVHPSWVKRFKKDEKKWIDDMRRLV